jgi:nondiscriminating glutamyl-tRNA synthetase
MIRTRFAPSPTGWLHIGNLRTAIYAYLYAKANSGQFLIRIEDTDKKREVDNAVEFIFDSLKLAGLSWDEGPDVGGDYGPYTQSERIDIYKEYAHKLVETGGGYYCFCTEEEIKADDYVDPCKNIGLESAKQKVTNGEPFVIKQAITPDQIIKYHDLIFGEITFNTSDLDEGVMLKSDGLPTYNFANVVDDHLMEITHVIRGSEYISSTPKYELLYKSFGWKAPKYIHVSHIMKDKQNKLSKRDGSASFMDLVEKGYLPEAIVNYIVLLGWHPKDERELFTLEELTKVFGINGIQKADALFDLTKLNWINSQYIRKLGFFQFHSKAMFFYPHEVVSKVNTEQLSKTLHKRIDFFGQIPEVVDFLREVPDFTLDLYVNEKMGSTLEITKNVLVAALPILDNISESEWSEDNIKIVLFDFVKKLNMQNGQVLWPLRIALSGKEFTPGGPNEIAAILGKTETISRIEKALKDLQA